MNKEEYFLTLKNYDEFDKNREKLRGLRMTPEVKEHIREIFPRSADRDPNFIKYYIIDKNS
jgi:seryl-tRNA(Sec) selenium transferase